ncbi:MAG: hypothetical protein LBH03_07535 [Holophagales bacterium]|nr:hypothetical protein [Holophagales bacterium]
MSDQSKQSLYGESDTLDNEYVQPLSLVDQVSGLFSEPVEMFKRLSKKPQWIGAILLLTALWFLALLGLPGLTRLSILLCRLSAPRFN